MNEKLRAAYLAYLADHNLKPRRLPANRQQLQEMTARSLYEAARRAGDPTAEALWATYQATKERDLAETRHPVVKSIDEAAEAIERSIEALPSFKKALANDIFAGEFPTGAINGEVVKTPHGFIVLVNSGAVTVLQQVSHLLIESDHEKPMDFAGNANAVAGVTEIIAEYLRSGDPFYGPRPFSVGQSSIVASLLSIAALKYVIAHEYAHVLAGHFADASPAFRILSTKAGAIEVLRKQWQQELEADDLGYRLSLGLEKYQDIDLTVIDRGLEAQEHVTPAVKLKCAIAAPFLLFTIAHLLERVQDAAAEARTARTHPPADLRFAKLLAHYGALSGRYSGYISLPVVLWEGRDRIVEGVLSKAAR